MNEPLPGTMPVPMNVETQDEDAAPSPVSSGARYPSPEAELWDDADARGDASEDDEQVPPALTAPAVEPIYFADVVSGQFDAQADAGDTLPAKRVLSPQAETPKLHKVLAQAGLGSRLEMERLITEGRISVNNEPAHIGQRIQFGDQIKVNGKPIRFRIAAPPARVIAYHKPVGEMVTHDDPQNRPTVFRKLPKLQQGKWQSVGRLDLNTEGLLLFTNSGELANKLMHPRFGLEREYAVRVLGMLSSEEKQRLLDGIALEDGLAQFGAIEEGGGEGANSWYRVTISEGRHREVRRLFEALGHAVSRLIRIRYGAMVLPRGLRRGAWVELGDREIRALMQAAGANGTGRLGEGGERDGDQPDRGARNRRRGNRNGGRGRNNGNGVDNSSRGQNQLGQGNLNGSGQGQPRGQNQLGQGNLNGSGQGQQRRKGRGGRGEPQGNAQPDPMKTAFGYIGADSFTRQRQGQGPGQRRGGSAGGQRRGGRSR